MPEHIIRFKLPEEESELNIMLKAGGMFSALWDFSQWLRQQLKYGHEFPTADDALEKAQEEFYRILEEQDVDLDSM